MKKRLQINFLIIAAISILAIMSFSTVIFYNLFQDEVMENLETSAYLLKTDVDDLKQLEKHVTDSKHEDIVRITLIQRDGAVIYDSNALAEEMENHGERPEIQEAFQKGEGQAVRKSTTLNKSSYYFAIKANENTVLRVAKNSQSFYSFTMRMFPMIGGIAVIMFIICAILSRILARSIVKPIETLAKNIDAAQPISCYKELAPLLATIQEQHEDLVKSSKMRQEFTANVSHELKTPLTSISGYSELIESGMATDSDVTRFAGEIHKNANRLLGLINDILQLSELDSRDFSAEFTPVDISSVARNCIQMLQLTAEKRKVTLYLQGSESCLVNGSPKMLEELIYNLIDNGIRYNNEGGSVFVTISKEDKTTVSVKDTGIGISRENQERVFERFYRVDKSRSKETGGTGLGLAIVKHIVVCHNADIQVISEEGEGTEIIVTFENTNE